MASSPDELDRRDRASTGVGFTAWLKDLRTADPDRVGEYSDLYFIIDSERFPPKFDFVLYGETIEELFDDPSDAGNRTALLLSAEREWRADMRAKMAARAALDLDPSGAAKLPVRDIPCDFTRRDGSKCGVPCVPGAPRCADHGGMILDPATRQSMLLVAYARLVEGSDTAVQSLIQVAEHSRNDIARVMAAKEILDRAGLSPELRIMMTSEETEAERFSNVRNLLEKTKERLEASSIATVAREIEAESKAPKPEPKDDKEKSGALQGELVFNDEDD